jgi:hypothetical protein
MFKAIVGAAAVAAGVADAVRAAPTTGQITALPGLAFQPDYNMYGGYVEYVSPMLKSTHYTYVWIVENKGTFDPNGPILFWTNGGKMSTFPMKEHAALYGCECATEFTLHTSVIYIC